MFQSCVTPHIAVTPATPGTRLDHEDSPSSHQDENFLLQVGAFAARAHRRTVDRSAGPESPDDMVQTKQSDI
jgi:hypothetical protein